MTWDESIFHLINGAANQSELMDWLMLQSSEEENLLFPIFLLVGYWAWSNWQEARIAAPTLALLIGVSDFVGAQLKHLIARPRPCQILTQINELVGCGGTLSMPSNHAFNSSTAAAFIFALYPNTAWVTGPIVVLIGISRVYLGAHYVTDVLVGWALGVALGCGIGWWLLRLPQFGRVEKSVNAKS